MGAAHTPPDHHEEHPPPLPRRRMVADHTGDRTVQPGQHVHHALPATAIPTPVASHAMNHTATRTGPAESPVPGYRSVNASDPGVQHAPPVHPAGGSARRA